MTPFRENLRGIISIAACNLFFLINDTQVKLAGADLPLTELLFIRGLLAALILIPIVIYAGSYHAVALIRHRWVYVRLFAEICATFLFLYALLHIPIANINAILQVVPLMVTAAAAIFLKEKVGWRRWLAIAIGFAGVLVVIRPGLAGFDAFALVALASMVFVTLRDITTRFMPRGLPALLVALVTAIAVGGAGLVLGLFVGEAWVVPSARSLALIAGASVFLIGGYLTAVDFMRHGDISVVAPFRYLVIVWAIIVGYIVWGEVPDLAMIVGTVIIIGTGIYTFHRERRLARVAAEPVDI
ncbi:MAG: DMT family transporter [Bauldia sp.]|nr:MAG: DMT family transporter [Bauldia sp.]